MGAGDRVRQGAHDVPVAGELREPGGLAEPRRCADGECRK